MNVRAFVISLLLCALVPGGAWAAPRVLKGRVVLEGSHGELTGAADVTVFMVATGDQTTTDSQGLFRLHLNKRFRPGEPVRLDIRSYKNAWRLQFPLNGEINLPADLDKQLIELHVLPVKSMRFWTEAQMAAFLQERTSEAKSKAIRTGEVVPADVARDTDDWALAHGFSASEFKAEIDNWVKNVERRGDDEEQLALAAFARGNYKQASDILDEATRKTDQQLGKKRGEVEVLEAKSARQHEKAGDADYNARDYPKALAHYEAALQNVSRQNERDKWISLMLSKAVTHVAQAESAQGPEISQNFDKAMAAYDELLETCLRREMPQEWARIQVSYGNALRSRGERAEKEEGVRLLKAAAWAYRGALEVHTREQWPQQWATARTQLGNALLRQSERVDRKQAERLLRTAVSTFQSALEVYARGQGSLEWAATQSSLADALLRQSSQDTLEVSFLRTEAIQACHAALEVRAREQWPQEWATTQDLLGNVLLAQAESAPREKSVPFFEWALKAFRATLEVRTREQVPQQWAMTQRSLGNALRGLSGRTTDRKEAIALLDQALTAYHAALDVLTREQVPQYWALTQSNLGNALLDQSLLIGGQEEAAQLANEAANAYQRSLEVFGDENTSLYSSPTHAALVQTRLVLAEIRAGSGAFPELDRVLQSLAQEEGLNVEESINLRTLELLPLLASRRLEAVPAHMDALRALVLAHPDAVGMSWFQPYRMRALVTHQRMAPFKSWLPLLVDAVNARNRPDLLFALDRARAELPR